MPSHGIRHCEPPVSGARNCILAMNRQSPSRHRERSVAIHVFLVRRHRLPRRFPPRSAASRLKAMPRSDGSRWVPFGDGSWRVAGLPARKLHSIHEPALLQSSLRAALAAWQSTCTAVLHHGMPRRCPPRPAASRLKAMPRSDGSRWVPFGDGSWRAKRGDPFLPGTPPWIATSLPATVCGLAAEGYASQ